MSTSVKDVYETQIQSVYATMQTNNFDPSTQIDAEKMMSVISIIANNNRIFFEVNNKIGQRKNDLQIKKIA